VPAGDVLVHASDLTINGMLSEVESFAKWIRGFPHRHKIVIAGYSNVRRDLAGLSYVQHELFEIAGLKV
jgi:hypothetical protein